MPVNAKALANSRVSEDAEDAAAVATMVIAAVQYWQA